jgi:hypothetical protein
MKKRMLLLVVFGISFTPAAFATDPVKHTGEQSFNEIMDVASLGVACNAKADAAKGSDEGSKSSSSSAKASSGAR